jgi:hypothetical protein
MDWTSVKAGDLILPTAVGHRVWRYRLGPPLRLLSFCLGASEPWLPDEPFRSDKEPKLEDKRMMHGVHAFATLEQLRDDFRNLADLPRYKFVYDGPDDPAWFDGVVRGTVHLWGLCIDCTRGYRAQYARPASFDEAHGERAEEALDRLRRMFGVA